MGTITCITSCVYNSLLLNYINCSHLSGAKKETWRQKHSKNVKDVIHTMCMYSSWNSCSVKKILIEFILIFKKKSVVQMLLICYTRSPLPHLPIILTLMIIWKTISTYKDINKNYIESKTLANVCKISLLTRLFVLMTLSQMTVNVVQLIAG